MHNRSATFSTARRLQRMAALMALACSLAACGGGSDTSEPTSGPTPAPSPSPSPAPSPSPSPAPAPAPTPAPAPAPSVSGRLWHEDYALDFRDGTQIASPDGGLPAQVTAELDAWPWPDGSQYATTDWNSDDEYTTLKVVDTASGNVLYSATSNRYLRVGAPSPVNKSMLLLSIADDVISPEDWIFVDLSTMTTVKQFPANDYISWLPDGRYLAVSVSGAMHIGQVDGGDTPAGQLSLPPGRQVGGVWVNRQGTQMALRLENPNTTDGEADIWVAGMDGSNLGRVTQTTMSYFPKWSPDGRTLAFDVDTGHFCNGVGCMGSCNLWWVPVEARNVVALPASGDANRFYVKDRDGQQQILGCELLAWTD